MNYDDSRSPIDKTTQASSILRVVEELMCANTSAAHDFADEIRFAVAAARLLVDDVSTFIVEEDAKVNP